jgi:hypothetical protein
MKIYGVKKGPDDRGVVICHFVAERMDSIHEDQEERSSPDQNPDRRQSSDSSSATYRESVTDKGI